MPDNIGYPCEDAISRYGGRNTGWHMCDGYSMWCASLAVIGHVVNHRDAVISYTVEKVMVRVIRVTDRCNPLWGVSELQVRVKLARCATRTSNIRGCYLLQVYRCTVIYIIGTLCTWTHLQGSSYSTDIRSQRKDRINYTHGDLENPHPWYINCW